MKIAVIGAGPAGLYFSLLAKKHDPRHEITVYEQNPQGATYGWGVVFSDIGLAFLREADPDFFDKFVTHHERCDYMEIVHRGTRVQVQGNHFSRTSRIDMLAVLERACLEAGVQIRHQQRVDDVAQLAAGVDMLVAADGSNSAVRKQYADHFRPAFERRRNKFAWYGTRQRFHPVSLIFREAEHGIFIAHSYQYSKDLSTFLVEVDPDSWRRAGLDTASEEESRRYCARVFGDDLGANGLLGNRSLWFEANIVRNERWSHENIVLLGDALRTVHFSLGSGTRMAMQDAIALHQGLLRHPGDVPGAFAQFEALRRPASSSFQAAAGRSLDWYENVAAKMHLDPVAFAYDYMRRTGQVSHDDLRQRDPAFAAAYETRHAVAA
ncbi:Probable tryptophan hydroxylase vioD [Achromobacter xylosoxidans]|uniref:FAD-dependent monooxygenase n=1 Tax=Alcaligenes xylosoxydans xylosoxydans TaxID=85698 RepID=UPI0001F42F9D|nr:FAD-dependent monooxygenase [Achromobacter xylosoxidans]EFV84845.1 monooxygenase [Achromobacter xylosoxidans C54]CUJ65888.1 Probable tryptophan hydroxylase vioD [Achromobacter xylosoxidans]CUK15370.1 Probable tryptophan hydroxylase vioD [Achromobacter xylosoxidans]